MRTVSIDRMEGNFAICEDSDGKFFALELVELPKGVKEGMVLQIDDEAGTLRVDEEETERRRRKAAHLQDRLFRKS